MVSTLETRLAGTRIPGTQQKLSEGSVVRTRLLAVLSLLSACLPLGADEGMWLFNRPPRELLDKQYGFKLDSAWLDHAQKASVRFNNGGSGGFVSADGLVV